MNWKQYNPKVSHVKPGAYLFEFQYEKDKLAVLGRSWSFYQKSTITLKAWDHSMDLENKIFDLIPVWVQFPNLEGRFWTSKGLSKITSYLGRPISSDSLTGTRTSLSFARLLVEVDVPKALHEYIPITGPNGEQIMQTVQYEFRMPKCSVCNMIGHDKYQCRKKQGDGKEGPKKTDKKDKKNPQKTVEEPVKDIAAAGSSKVIKEMPGNA